LFFVGALRTQGPSGGEIIINTALAAEDVHVGIPVVADDGLVRMGVGVGGGGEIWLSWW
jgi:hypothetical protein